jgi:hypothetical protein
MEIFNSDQKYYQKIREINIRDIKFKKRYMLIFVKQFSITLENSFSIRDLSRNYLKNNI